MILRRYICQEIVITMIAITTVLIVIFLSNHFLRYIQQAAVGKLSGDLLFQIMLLQIPRLLGYLLPLGLFISILVVFGRMYVDNEMAVLRASGFSQKQCLKIVMLVAVGVSIVVGILAIDVNPKLVKSIEKLLKQAKTQAVIDMMMPGRFRTSPDGKQIYYAEEITRDREHMKNVFMAEEVKDPDLSGAHYYVLSAEDGYLKQDPQSDDRFLVLQNGYRYYGTPGEADYRSIQFSEYQIRIQEPPIIVNRDEESWPIQRIWKKRDNSRYMAELNWRIGLPLSVILLALLAVPLSKVKPRQGKYAQLLPAILIYVVYANVMFVARSWIEDQKVPGWLGLWWVHGGLLLLIFYLYWKPRKQKSRAARKQEKAKESTLEPKR